MCPRAMRAGPAGTKRGAKNKNSLLDSLFSGNWLAVFRETVMPTIPFSYPPGLRRYAPSTRATRRLLRSPGMHASPLPAAFFTPWGEG